MGHFNHIKFAALSDVGRKRKNNEDSFGTFPKAGVFCVADGMGGGDDGEVASAATVKAVETFVTENPLPTKLAYPIDSVVSAIRSAVNSASSWILSRAQERHLKGCGSTFVGVCFDPASPAEAVALHAGDSRLYRVRGRSIQQITKDHSAAELIGAKNEDDINPMFRGMILRAVGIQAKVEVDATPFQVKQDDRIVICSDGLSKMLPDKRIASITRDAPTVDIAVKELIDAANQAGGLDNVTAIVIEVGPLPQALPTTEMPAWNVTDVKEEIRDFEGHTMDTNGDTGVTFDFGSASGSNTTTGGLGTESVTGFTITIPEESSEDPASIATPRTAETGAGPDPAGAKEAGPRPRNGVGMIVVTAVSAAVVAVCALIAFLVSRRDAVPADDSPHAAQVADSVTQVPPQSVAGESDKPDAVVVSPEEEARIRAEAEEAARRAEEDRKRREELRRSAEDARKESLRRQEEARKAGEREELERKRLEDERKRLEAERDRRRMEEEARRRAEEERRLREEKARLAAEREEKLRKEKAERERAAKEKALAEKLEKERAAAKAARHRRLAFAVLKKASKERLATTFVRKVQTIVPKGTLDSLCQVFYPMSHASGDEASAKASADLASCMQTVVAKLVEYAEVYLNDVQTELRDPLTSADYKKELKDVPSKMKEFLKNSKRILGKDVTDPDVHMACALMIEMVPVWF